MSRPFASLVSAAELRTLLSASESTVRRWIAQRRIPAPIMIGKKAFWHEEELQKALDAARSDGPPPPPPDGEAPPAGEDGEGGDFK
jgi:excisionase family DNA binding protein